MPLSSSATLTGAVLRCGRSRACIAALGLYVVTQFTGLGRLNLVSLGLALALVVQDSIRFRHLKWAVIIATIPALIVFGALGRNRSPTDPAAQQAGGLVSVVTPLNNFAREIQGGLSHGGPSPLIGDITFPIPRSVWHSKPLAFDQTLASFLDPTEFALNPGLSASALNQGEWYYIAGWEGLVLMVLFTGFVVAWLDKHLRRNQSLRVTEVRAFLGFVALCILASGLPNLAWAGTTLWTGRAIPCLLALVPFWLLAFAGSAQTSWPTAVHTALTSHSTVEPAQPVNELDQRIDRT